MTSYEGLIYAKNLWNTKLAQITHLTLDQLLLPTKSFPPEFIPHLMRDGNDITKYQRNATELPVFISLLTTATSASCLHPETECR